MAKQHSKKMVADSISWYAEKRPIYAQLSKKIESIIQEIITDQKIPVHSIYSRTKESDSFAKKIEDPKYTDPSTQITDFSGIRIIVYVESDLDKISKLIEEHFDVDPENSIDKSKSLGTDKVGYRSIHYIASLFHDRIKLPEYKKFKDLCFEIQIRTILQHAWAEIEHDKNYKFSGELPIYLKRRFKVLAGVLELADREFNSIADEIDKYSDSVNADTKIGKLDIPIDSTSLKSFLSIKFADLIEKGMRPEFFNEDYEIKVLTELRDFGVTTLKQLDNIIPSDFSKKTLATDPLLAGDSYIGYNYGGLLRHILMINDAPKYFKECWKHNWTKTSYDSVNLIKLFNPDIENILQSNGIDIDNA